MTNPFKKDSTSYKDWEKLKDLNWHCAKCDLESAQAKTWQIWRQMGICFDKDEKGNNYKKMYCENCETNTVHRKLVSLELSENTQIRSSMPASLSRRIKEFYKFEEAVFKRKMMPNELEIDHRFPQIRWSSDEGLNDVDMSYNEIKNKFMLLTRSNNLLKSRYCERCVKENIRGSFPGINFWYKGDQNWISDKNDENGCIGCFWYDPETWKNILNSIINNKS